MVSFDSAIMLRKEFIEKEIIPALAGGISTFTIKKDLIESFCSVDETEFLLAGLGPGWGLWRPIGSEVVELFHSISHEKALLQIQQYQFNTSSFNTFFGGGQEHVHGT